jgi:hypothetical protein
LEPDATVWPQLHAVQVVAPAADTLLPRQPTHWVAPGKAEKVPAPHAVHAVAPTPLAPTPLKVPAGQSMAAAEPLEDTKEPAGLVTQAPLVVDPVSGLYVPAAHAVHVVPASESWYVPAADNDAVRGRTCQRKPGR